MIQITDKFHIDADQFCFHVVEKRDGVSPKTKEPVVTERRTYHPNLEQCLNYIRRQEAKECKTVEELSRLLEKSYQLDKQSVLSVLSAGKKVNHSGNRAA